jgi:hypothetical protein
MKTKVTYSYPLSVADFGLVVNIIADGYFSEDGEYDPTTGMLNTMYAFYKFCYKRDDEEVDTAEKMAEIAEKNGDFILDYNQALDCDVQCFNFANAYREAMELVRYRQESAVLLVNKLKSALDGAAQKLNQFASENLGTLANEIKESGISAEDIGTILQSMA